MKFTIVSYLALFICLACQKRQVFDFSSEPADPDPYDMSMWNNMEAEVYSGFGSLDSSYSKSIPPKGKITESIRLQGWKGERVYCKLLIWTSADEGQISVDAEDLKNQNNRIDEENISISIVQYVYVDQFLNELSRACGPRDNEKVPVHIRSDLLRDGNTFILNGPETRPVWIAIDIPSDASSGIYSGQIERRSNSGVEKHSITLEVLERQLPDPSVWVFHLDLWQNPFAIARYHKVDLWSDKHMELLRSYLTMLAEAGQKCITATLIDKPWGENKPCYDDFRSMISWTKKKDGTWQYDYTIFDRYVQLAMDCGIKKQINCYTMVPIRNDFTWFDEQLSDTVVVELFPGTRKYELHWRPFLSDFSNHLRDKGWLDITTIGLDERGEEEMAKMFSFMKEAAPEFKIAMAGFYHESINSSIYDFSSNWRDYGRIPQEKIASRKDEGLITTYYVACGIPKPNNFTFSPPAESCYEGWLAAAMGFDGFLRWAYNSWPEDPLVDSRYIKWPSGDTYFIYPGPLSSVRFERLREGIQDYEKIRILSNELDENSAEKEKLMQFLDSINPETLATRTASEVINEGKLLIYELSKSY